MNRSPWLHDLNRTRSLYRLDQTRSEDIVIVGGGIAGLMTSAFTLLSTKRSILLLEATRIAHGATGHNAGQIISCFERPLPDLVKSYGLSATRDLVVSIESAWQLLDSLVTTLALKTPIQRFLGYTTLSSPPSVHEFIKASLLRLKMGLSPHTLYVDETRCAHILKGKTFPFLVPLPTHQLARLVETSEPNILAVHAEPKGTMNSAELTEEIASVLLQRFPDRFTILEETPVHDVFLNQNKGKSWIVLTHNHTVHAQTIILCTNGFESLHLHAEDEASLDTRFHASIEGTIGYMVGYVTEEAPPMAMSFLGKKGAVYPYLTCHPHGKASSLVCWGGPEKHLPEVKHYARSTPMPKARTKELHALVKKFRPKEAKKPFLFEWHGLMGYTRDRLRLIGQDPSHPNLLYNLGCNGIGVLPSIYGGKRLAGLLAGEKLAPSLFDPKRLKKTK